MLAAFLNWFVLMVTFLKGQMFQTFICLMEKSKASTFQHCQLDDGSPQEALKGAVSNGSLKIILPAEAHSQLT